MIVPIVVGALATFVFGMLWYGPLFGKQWMRMMRITQEDMAEAKKRGMAVHMTVMAIFLIITAWVVSNLLPQLLPLSYTEFLHAILLIWLGFAFPVQLGAWLWDRKSFKLVLFNAVQSIISFGILSAIIYYWQ